MAAAAAPPPPQYTSLFYRNSGPLQYPLPDFLDEPHLYIAQYVQNSMQAVVQRFVAPGGRGDCRRICMAPVSNPWNSRKSPY